MFEAALSGFSLGIGLIAAIGAQNAFVLRQGLRREHVLPVVLTCAVSDAILIALGVAGFGAAKAMVPWLETALLWLGVCFLVIYGAQRFLTALKGADALMPSEQSAASLAATLTTCLIFTWANPHVYLDTVVLLGSISAQFSPYEGAFAIGAIAASFTFFTLLGFGARLLAPLFARPQSWVVLEIIVGATLWFIAARLAFTA